MTRNDAAGIFLNVRTISVYLCQQIINFPHSFSFVTDMSSSFTCAATIAVIRRLDRRRRGFVVVYNHLRTSTTNHPVVVVVDVVHLPSPSSLPSSLAVASPT